MEVQDNERLAFHLAGVLSGERRFENAARSVSLSETSPAWASSSTSSLNPGMVHLLVLVYISKELISHSFTRGKSNFFLCIVALAKNAVKSCNLFIILRNIELLNFAFCALIHSVKQDELSYLSVSNYKDLPKGRERMLYKFFEMLPGLLILGTFALALVFSWLKPLWVAIFIIAFDLYWIFKVVYLSIHTRSSYRRMKRYLKVDWLAETEKLPASKSIWHLVILPMYKETYEVVRPALEALARSHWPKERMIVVLATEEAAGEEASRTAERIYEEYKEKLPNLFVTRHPENMPGEIPGKGSNERWAGIWIKENVIDKKNIPYEHIIVSSLDADTVVYPHYFSRLAYLYLTCEKPLRSSFQPVPLFINNIWQAPAVSRIVAFSSTFWHTMNQDRPEKHLTFSSHSMPFAALVDIGFWQPDVVSEDSRIFWQCFLYYGGDYRVISMHYPVSMDANVARSFWRTLRNVYKQQRRWAYGAADIAYFLFGFLKKRKEIPKKLMWQYGFSTIEGFFSWATHAILIFVLGWLPLVLGGDAFNTTLISYNLPRITRILLTIAMIGIISSVFLSVVILPPRPPKYGKWKYLAMVAQWLLIPFTLIFFGAFPSIEAQVRLMFGRYLGFWSTEKFRK